MARAEDTQTLDEVWIHPFAPWDLAQSSRLSVANVQNATTCFWKAKRGFDRGNTALPGEFATVELRDDENLEPHEIGFKASDFVRLIRIDAVRKTMRAGVRGFGPKAEEAGLQLADYLERTYGATKDGDQT